MIIKIAVSFLTSILLLSATMPGMLPVELAPTQPLKDAVVNPETVVVNTGTVATSANFQLEASLPPTQTVELTFRPYIVTTGGAVNIRACPAVNNNLCPPLKVLEPQYGAEIIGVDSQTGWWQVSFGGETGWITNSPALVQVKGDTQYVPVIASATLYLPAADSYTSETMRVLFEEMALVQLLAEDYARVETVCAGIGLKNIAPTDKPIIIIPNAGDLSVAGSNVAIELRPGGEIVFIPRVPGQRIRIPMDLVGEKKFGFEESTLTLAEAEELMAAGQMYWTASIFGPFGNGHGLPGHIAACDPRYPGP